MTENGQDRDPLEGFRGDETSEQLEAGLRRNLGENAYLVDIWQIGKVMAAFTETPAGCYLVKTLQDDLHTEIKALLAEADPGSDKARTAFFAAKANLAALDVIESAVKNGAEAERRMAADDEVTP